MYTVHHLKNCRECVHDVSSFLTRQKLIKKRADTVEGHISEGEN